MKNSTETKTSQKPSYEELERRLQIAEQRADLFQDRANLVSAMTGSYVAAFHANWKSVDENWQPPTDVTEKTFTPLDVTRGELHMYHQLQPQLQSMLSVANLNVHIECRGRRAAGAMYPDLFATFHPKPFSNQKDVFLKSSILFEVKQKMTVVASAAAPTSAMLATKGREGIGQVMKWYVQLMTWGADTFPYCVVTDLRSWLFLHAVNDCGQLRMKSSKIYSLAEAPSVLYGLAKVIARAPLSHCTARLRTIKEDDEHKDGDDTDGDHVRADKRKGSSAGTKRYRQTSLLTYVKKQRKDDQQLALSIIGTQDSSPRRFSSRSAIGASPRSIVYSALDEGKPVAIKIALSPDNAIDLELEILQILSDRRVDCVPAVVFEGKLEPSQFRAVVYTPSRHSSRFFQISSTTQT